MRIKQLVINTSGFSATRSRSVVGFHQVLRFLQRQRGGSARWQRGPSRVAAVHQDVECNDEDSSMLKKLLEDAYEAQTGDGEVCE